MPIKTKRIILLYKILIIIYIIKKLYAIMMKNICIINNKKLIQFNKKRHLIYTEKTPFKPQEMRKERTYTQ
jgi:hypothetical protein